MLHRFGELWLVPGDVAFGGFVQIIIEGLLHAPHVPFFDQQLREMRTSRHPPAARLYFVERNIQAEIPEPSHQPHIAVAARCLQIADPFSKNVEAVRVEEWVQEIAQQVHRMTVQLSRELDSAHQFQSRLSRQGQSLVISGKRIVVGDPQGADPGAPRLVHQLRRRIGSVGRRGVRVQINHR